MPFCDNKNNNYSSMKDNLLIASDDIKSTSAVTTTTIASKRRRRNIIIITTTRTSTTTTTTTSAQLLQRRQIISSSSRLAMAAASRGQWQQQQQQQEENIFFSLWNRWITEAKRAIKTEASSSSSSSSCFSSSPQASAMLMDFWVDYNEANRRRQRHQKIKNDNISKKRNDPNKNSPVHLLFQSRSEAANNNDLTAVVTSEEEEEEELNLANDNNNNNFAGNNNNDDDNNGVDHKSRESNKGSTITIHSFWDRKGNKTYKALNTSKRRFLAFLKYQNSTLDTKSDRIVMEQVKITNNYYHCSNSSSNKMIASNGSDCDGAEVKFWNEIRLEWRELWKKRQLLTDRTELLTVYPSDIIDDDDDINNDDADATMDKAQNIKKKRGGFADLLHLYTERLVAILSDEQEEDDKRLLADEEEMNMVRRHRISSHAVADGGNNNIDAAVDLVSWLQKHHGVKETNDLCPGSMCCLTEAQQLRRWKTFLEWFKSEFPYYYDRCDSCGASNKEDLAAKAAEDTIQEHEEEQEKLLQGNSIAAGGDNDDDDDNDNESEHRTFVGYLYPLETELLGKASRTELYQCHSCGSFTRFPRFNAATRTLQTRRGRCGEYSMLLMRFLRALGHHCRWIVDWADHVWVEIEITSSIDNDDRATVTVDERKEVKRWVHLDPCEAAVDENLLYQSWGKKQTYILGLCPPLPPASCITETSSASDVGVGHTNESIGLDDSPAIDRSKPARQMEDSRRTVTPMIEDVTRSYTTDSWEEVCKRRNESPLEINLALEEAQKYLQSTLEASLEVNDSKTNNYQ